MSIALFLKHDSKSLGTLLTKLNQFKQWNGYLRDCLVNEPHLADHCHIVNLINHSLIVIVDSPHGSTRLRFYVPELLPKLKAYPGLEDIRAICSKVSPKMNFPQKAKRIPLKLSGESAEKIKETALKTKDEALAAILLKLASRS